MAWHGMDVCVSIYRIALTNEELLNSATVSVCVCVCPRLLQMGVNNTEVIRIYNIT